MDTLDKHILILDDFYDDPASVLAVAENKYPQTYFGMSKQGFIPEGTRERFEWGIGRKIVEWEVLPKNPLRNGYFWKSVTLGYNNEVERLHYDPPVNYSGGLVYLSPDVDPQFGTSFWRHKSTGQIMITPDEYDTAVGDQIDDDLMHNPLDHFEKVLQVEYKSNRALVFSAGLFHASEKFMPEDNSQVRMTHLFHFLIEGN